ncbi:sperm motility kinase X-like [Acomys russatus]|uniref:sperm motility kinase X-like n=1 Tax=Acomys russatus TaxID=60746 RepID=UPI0021E2476F|nr:sperm motility kinase X-like [Acomys russatus]
MMMPRELKTSPFKGHILAKDYYVLGTAHIIQLLQVIETSQKTYLVIEYTAWGPLMRHLRKHGHLEEEEPHTLFQELTLAIKYIHSYNTAHRDIKPENILLDWDGHVKLSDSGLCKKLASRGNVRGFWGTQYCAPDVFSHKEYEGLPPDVWRLGVVLYFTVSGHLPFRETDHSKIRQQILS